MITDLLARWKSVDAAPEADPTGVVPGGPVRRGDRVLEVEHLSVHFGVNREWAPAAIDLTYHVDAGEVLAIVGESGSGKSASSTALLGLLPSNSRLRGSVRLAGRETLGLRPGALRSIRGSEVTVIFQEPMTALNPDYTVGEQIVETLRLHNRSRRARRPSRTSACSSSSSCPTRTKPSTPSPTALRRAAAAAAAAAAGR